MTNTTVRHVLAAVFDPPGRDPYYIYKMLGIALPTSSSARERKPDKWQSLLQDLFYEQLEILRKILGGNCQILGEVDQQFNQEE